MCKYRLDNQMDTVNIPNMKTCSLDFIRIRTKRNQGINENYCIGGIYLFIYLFIYT